MKFDHKVACKCGGTFSFSTTGDRSFPDTLCSKCGMTGYLSDPLSASLIAERLLHRGKDELDSGDYSLSIVIGTMAVETFLTRLYLKLKGMDSFAASFTLPTPAQETNWEREYPRSGGFPQPADFVSRELTGEVFDNFVSSNNVAHDIFAALPQAAGRSPVDYFQIELFKRRNRIAHRGYVNSEKHDAALCHKLAVAIVSILREMDRSRYGAL